MACDFVPCDRDLGYLQPPPLADGLPDNYVSWFIVNAAGRSGLQIEELRQTDAACKVIAENCAPDPITIVRSRKDNDHDLKELNLMLRQFDANRQADGEGELRHGPNRYQLCSPMIGTCDYCARGSYAKINRKSTMEQLFLTKTIA